MNQISGPGSHLLYKQVEENIRSQIAAGNWKAGDRIPGENELSQTFGVSRVTLRNAIARLVEQGVLIRLHGKGTYVTSEHTANSMREEMQSLTTICRRQGRTITSKILFADLREPDDAARHFLLIPSDEKAFVIERVRMVDHIPLLIETATFRYSYLYLKECDLTGSLYNILAEYRITPYKAEKTVGICHATEEEGEHLNIPAGTALLLNCAKVNNAKGEPLHTVRHVSRGDLPEIFQYYV